MNLPQELARLEADLERVEERYFAARANGGVPAELELERRKLIEAIVEIERELDPDVRRNPETSYQRQRYRELGREWERWRYRRSKLPKHERGPMMKVGQRECPYCGDYFEPATMRQRYCTPTHRKMAHKRERGS